MATYIIGLKALPSDRYSLHGAVEKHYCVKAHGLWRRAGRFVFSEEDVDSLWKTDDIRQAQEYLRELTKNWGKTYSLDVVVLEQEQKTWEGYTT